MKYTVLTKVVAAALVALSFSAVDAAEVSTNDAARAVRAWVRRGGRFGAALKPKVQRVDVHSTAAGAKFYAVKTTGGTVFTSADTELEPVIAFTGDGADFSQIDRKSPLYALLSRDLAARTARPKQAKLAAKTAAAVPAAVSPMAGRWAELVAEDEDFEAGRLKLPVKAGMASYDPVENVGDLRVPPIVKTKWGQSTDSRGNQFFNGNTPNHYVCGCVATAMAQIMKVHEYPSASVTPQTKRCFVDDIGPYNYMMQGGVYDWAHMVDDPENSQITTTEINATCRLTYDCGVSVCMNWGEDGSSAITANVPDALRDVFGYQSARITSDDTAMELDRTVLPNLDAGYPVMLGICSYDESEETTSNGHAIVGDGYGYVDSMLYVHLNMGWSGEGDIWYNLPEIPVESQDYYANVVEEVVFNIIPNAGDDQAILSGRVTLPNGKGASGAEVKFFAPGSGTPVRTVTANRYGVWGTLLPTNVLYTVSATLGDYAVTYPVPRLKGAVYDGDYNFYAIFNGQRENYTCRHCCKDDEDEEVARNNLGNLRLEEPLALANPSPSETPVSTAASAELAATQFTAFSHTFSASGGNEPYSWSVAPAEYADQVEDSSTFAAEGGTPLRASGGRGAQWFELAFKFKLGDRTFDRVCFYEGRFCFDAETPWNAQYVIEVGAFTDYAYWSLSPSDFYVTSTTDMFTLRFGTFGAITLRADGGIVVKFGYSEWENEKLKVTERQDMVDSSIRVTAAGEETFSEYYALEWDNEHECYEREGPLGDVTIFRKGLPAGLELDEITGVLSGKPSSSGEYDFDVVVMDAEGAEAAQAVTLTVAATSNQPPAINWYGDNTTANDEMIHVDYGDTFDFWAYAVDQENHAITYRWYVDGQLVMTSTLDKGFKCGFTYEAVVDDVLEYGARSKKITVKISDDVWENAVSVTWDVAINNTWYVDATAEYGEDEWPDGSEDQPLPDFDFERIDGDVVYVAPGEYGGFGCEGNVDIRVIATDGPESTVLQEVNIGDRYSEGSSWNAWLEGFTINGKVYGGTLVNCIVTGCEYDEWEPEAAAVNRARLCNTVVTGNGTLGVDRSEIYNSTVAGNAGGGVCATYAYNSIVWANGGDNYDEYCEFDHCIYDPDSDADPKLADPEHGDCRLRSGSPCIDAGDNSLYRELFSDVEEDLAGNARIQNSTIDIGAYEGAGVSGFVIAVNIVGNGGSVARSAASVAAGESITFTASGRPLNHWEINGVTVSADPVYTWSNIQADGSITAYFDPQNFYVNAVTGSDTENDGMTAQTPFRSISRAIAAAQNGETVYVAPGVYDRVVVEDEKKSLEIVSTGTRENTIIDGGGTDSCFSQWSCLVTLRGFTFRNGYGEYSGGGVRGGTLIDCVITNCTLQSSYNGRSLFGAGAIDSTLYDCLVVDNHIVSSYGSGYGGGCSGCYLSNCVVRANSISAKYTVSGGGCYGGNGSSIVIDSRITDNWIETAGSSYYYQGAGVCNCSVYNSYVWDNWVGDPAYSTTRQNVYNLRAEEDLFEYEPDDAEADYLVDGVWYDDFAAALAAAGSEKRIKLCRRVTFDSLDLDALLSHDATIECSRYSVMTDGAPGITVTGAFKPSQSYKLTFHFGDAYDQENTEYRVIGFGNGSKVEPADLTTIRVSNLHEYYTFNLALLRRDDIDHQLKVSFASYGTIVYETTPDGLYSSYRRVTLGGAGVCYAKWLYDTGNPWVFDGDMITVFHDYNYVKKGIYITGGSAVVEGVFRYNDSFSYLTDRVYCDASSTIEISSTNNLATMVKNAGTLKIRMEAALEVGVTNRVLQQYERLEGGREKLILPPGERAAQYHVQPGDGWDPGLYVYKTEAAEAGDAPFPTAEDIADVFGEESGLAELLGDDAEKLEAFNEWAAGNGIDSGSFATPAAKAAAHVTYLLSAAGITAEPHIFTGEPAVVIESLGTTTYESTPCLSVKVSVKDEADRIAVVAAELAKKVKKSTTLSSWEPCTAGDVKASAENPDDSVTLTIAPPGANRGFLQFDLK